MLFVSVALMALVSEYVDSSLGMGYGTTLTPVLIIMGYQPIYVVPAILLSEFVTGISSGLLHHNQGNVNLGRGTRARKTTAILAICSLVGTVIAVFAAVNLPKTIVKSYIGIMILGIGVFILLTRGTTGRFSFRKIVGLGSVAAFNKGISGGGYGPLVTGGQVALGVPEKSAVGITSLAEGLVCATGLALYFIMNRGMAWGLALPLTIGALLSVPAAVWTVKLMPPKMLRQSIGYATIFLGTLTLVRVLI
ncbi:MAG: sulfite exporter TauE/SafE family protein [Candidatus Eisenbacteria bacterium]|nr:sulfite exporter TauE/SafE family protein [Candidatus Eisenbacteria bacterium]